MYICCAVTLKDYLVSIFSRLLIMSSCSERGLLSLLLHCFLSGRQRPNWFPAVAVCPCCSLVPSEEVSANQHLMPPVKSAHRQS